MRVELALVRKVETYLTYLTSEHFSLMEFRVSAKRRGGRKIWQQKSKTALLGRLGQACLAYLRAPQGFMIMSGQPRVLVDDFVEIIDVRSTLFELLLGHERIGRCK